LRGKEKNLSQSRFSAQGLEGFALSPELELWQIWGIRQLWQIWGIRHLLVTFGGSRNLIHTGVLRSAQDDTSKQRQEQEQD
jgi:hypothetical protein